MEIQELPKSLKDITLSQWIGWNDTYGQHLLKKAKTKKTEDESLLFETEFYSKHYAYYSDTPLEEVEAAIYTNAEDTQVLEVCKEAALSQAMLFREMCDLANIDVVNTVFEDRGIKFKIAPPITVLDESHKLTLAEFEKIQDVALVFSDLQDGKFDALYELCCEYIQPVEPTAWEYKEIKMQWLKSLPLHIALCVKQYVESTITLYKTLSNVYRK